MLQPCFGSFVTESLVTNPCFHVQPDFAIPKSQPVAASRAHSTNSKRTSFLVATIHVCLQERCERMGHDASLLEVHLDVVIANGLQELEQLNLGNLQFPHLQKTLDVHGTEHDRLRLIQCTLNGVLWVLWVLWVLLVLWVLWVLLCVVVCCFGSCGSRGCCVCVVCGVCGTND